MYYITIDGQPADCYRAHSSKAKGDEYYFVPFEFDKKAEIRFRIATWKSIDNYKAHPRNVKFSKDGATGVIKARKPPFTAVVSPDNRELPLVFFGYPIETQKPSPTDPNVVYFPKGVHVVEHIKLTSGQTLYLEAGAVLKTSIYASGKDITICGRGIISGELKTRISKHYFMRFEKCENLRIKDVIIKDAPGWTLFIQDCDGVSINNVKICNGRTINDDAIDICNSSNVSIKNVFARAQDDIVAIKGKGALPDGVCENISVRDCIFWTDRANIFRIGYESDAKSISNVRVKDIYVPFYATDCVGLDSPLTKGIITLQAGNKMVIENVSFDGIDVHSDGGDQNVFVAKSFDRIFGNPTTPGVIKNCSVRNVSVFGAKGGFRGSILLRADDGGKIGDIGLFNFNYFGVPITEKFEFFAPNNALETRIKYNPAEVRKRAERGNPKTSKK